VKFPLLFYAVERFRKHLKRIVFGEKFWAGRPQMKLRLTELEGVAFIANRCYANEHSALVETSRSIVFDAIETGIKKKKKKKFELHDRFSPVLRSLDHEELIILKNVFGYERCRQLVLDSDIYVDSHAFFLDSAFGESEPLLVPPRGLNVFPNGEVPETG
jgi:hypothetical protein